MPWEHFRYIFDKTSFLGAPDNFAQCPFHISQLVGAY